MEKQISFSEGLVNTPYSDVSPDGQCRELHGLEVNAGSLKPCLIKGNEITDIDGRILFIHKTNQYIHYIYRKDSKIGYYEQQEEDNVNIVFGLMKDIGEFTDVSASGNILLFLREDDEPFAYLWEEGEYKKLGTMPELEMQFSLEPVAGGYVAAIIKEDDDDATKFDKVKGLYNEAEQKFCNKSGSFLFPFFARAAFKTFDGRYMKQTTPVLMIPNTLLTIRRMYRDNGDEIDGVNYSELPNDIAEEDKPYAYYMGAPTSRLCADLLTTIPSVWKSIIQSIDIFVTPPIYPFDNANKHVLKPSVLEDVYNVQVTMRGGPANTAESNYHTYRRKESPTIFMMPNLTPDEALSSSEIGFVKVASYGLGENAINKVMLREGSYNAIAASLTNALENDYMSHDKIAAKAAFVYNKRTTLYNSKVIRYWGAGEERYQRIDYIEPQDGVFNNTREYKVYEVVYDEGERRLRYICDYPIDYLHWWYTQNSNVKSIVIRNGNLYDEINLQPHAFWGGSAYLNFAGYELGFQSDWLELEQYVTDERIIDEKPNVLYTSAVNNPFLYQSVGETTVGTGIVVKLATMTTVLSEGQAGQFDMIALTDEGNFALSLIKTGTNAGLVESITPMRPDVCINKDGVCQDEGGIVMVTANGLVLLASNATTPLSNKLKGVHEAAEISQTINRPSVRPQNAPILIAKYDISCRRTTNPMYQVFNFPAKSGSRYQIVLRPCAGYAVNAEYSLYVGRTYNGNTISNDGELLASGIVMSNGIANEYEWECDDNNIETSLILECTAGNPIVPPTDYITIEIYPADNTFEKYDTYDVTDYKEVTPVGYPSASVLARGGDTTIKYNLKAGKRYIMVLNLRDTITALSEPLLLDLMIGNILVSDRVLYFGDTFKNRIIVYSFTSASAQNNAFVSFSVPNDRYTYEILNEETALLQLYEEKDETPEGEEPEEDEDETWKDNYPMDDVDLTAYMPIEFIKRCTILKDVVNNRLLITAVGCSEYYQLSLNDGAWNTASFHKKVKVIYNVYPFSYIQFADNNIVRFDKDANTPTEDEDIHKGLLITRPMKLDSLLLKRITEFAVQGNYSDKQRLTLWGSNDLKRWFKLGTTERRRVGAMRGYYFKYWRMSIETNLKENENISGVLVRYTVKDDGRFR